MVKGEALDRAAPGHKDPVEAGLATANVPAAFAIGVDVESHPALELGEYSRVRLVLHPHSGGPHIVPGAVSQPPPASRLDDHEEDNQRKKGKDPEGHARPRSRPRNSATASSARNQRPPQPGRKIVISSVIRRDSVQSRL